VGAEVFPPVSPCPQTGFSRGFLGLCPLVPLSLPAAVFAAGGPQLRKVPGLVLVLSPGLRRRDGALAPPELKKFLLFFSSPRRGPLSDPTFLQVKGNTRSLGRIFLFPFSFLPRRVRSFYEREREYRIIPFQRGGGRGDERERFSRALGGGGVRSSLVKERADVRLSEFPPFLKGPCNDVLKATRGESIPPQENERAPLNGQERSQ